MLTDLFNRRAFVERASAQLSQGVRQRLVMADIDHFKQINDTLGHATGDATLRHVAAALCTHAPEGSIVARIGGEEFALLIPAWRVDDAAIEHMVGHLRVAMEALDLPGIALTCSFGMAVSQDGEGLDNLLSRADKALYRAKRAGRDRLAKAA
jgi:diguanylate cyclase (GGDEF)-like protein